MPRGRCESDECSADGLGVTSDRSDGGAEEPSDSPDGADDGGVGQASDGAGVPSVRDIEGLIIFLSPLVSRPWPQFLDSGFCFDMVDESFARRH